MNSAENDSRRWCWRRSTQVVVVPMGFLWLLEMIWKLDDGNAETYSIGWLAARRQLKWLSYARNHCLNDRSSYLISYWRHIRTTPPQHLSCNTSGVRLPRNNNYCLLRNSGINSDGDETVEH
jgi:hypothetical protein